MCAEKWQVWILYAKLKEDGCISILGKRNVDDSDEPEEVAHAS